MVPPTIAMPVTIPIFFIIFLLRNFALSDGVSLVGDAESPGYHGMESIDENDDGWPGCEDVLNSSGWE